MTVAVVPESIYIHNILSDYFVATTVLKEFVYIISFHFPRILVGIIPISHLRKLKCVTSHKISKRAWIQTPCDSRAVNFMLHILKLFPHNPL